jgi:hypothetical protein
MWIVQLALRRPYTFIVLAIFILIAGVLSILRTPKDIFPDINIPVCAAIWNFTGMPAQEFSNRITSVYERILTTVHFIQRDRGRQNLFAAERKRSGSDGAVDGCVAGGFEAVATWRNAPIDSEFQRFERSRASSGLKRSEFFGATAQ